MSSSYLCLLSLADIVPAYCRKLKNSATQKLKHIADMRNLSYLNRKVNPKLSCVAVG